MSAIRAVTAALLVTTMATVAGVSPVAAGGQIQVPPNPDDVRFQKALQHSPDLVVKDLRISAGGFVAFTVQNQGQVLAATPFVADIFVNDVRRDTIKLEPLRATSAYAVQSMLARAPDCKPVLLKVVLDAQNVIAEASESNNAHSRQVIPPCPDGRFQVGPLAPGQSYSFHEFEKHLASTRMEYRAIVDFYNAVFESDESNNTARATLGGL